jgi:hypothetical protein
MPRFLDRASLSGTVDETQPSNDNPASYLVALVQADGRKDLERNANSGDPADTFPGSSQVTSVSDTTNPSTTRERWLAQRYIAVLDQARRRGRDDASEAVTGSNA